MEGQLGAIVLLIVIENGVKFIVLVIREDLWILLFNKSWADFQIIFENPKIKSNSSILALQRFLIETLRYFSHQHQHPRIASEA